MIQVGLIDDLSGKGGDNFRIADVLALSHHGHQQMFAYQPGHQLAVIFGQAVLTAKFIGILGAQFLMTATATLGNIVKQASQIQQLRFVQMVENTAGQGEFMGKVGHRQAAHITQHEQCVLIHRIGVEQVILHAPDNLVKCRDIGGQNAVAVHAAQLMGDPPGLFDNVDKQFSGGFRLAEFVIDQVAVFPDQANGFRAHAANIRAHFHNQKQFQQGRGVLFKHLRIAGFNIAVAQLEAIIEHFRLLAVVCV